MTDGNRLIKDLLDHPKEFYAQGCGYDLLQEYFNGFPVRTLSSLLRSNDNFVKRVSVWIASELGTESSQVITDIVPLLANADEYIRVYALEVVAVCSAKTNESLYVHVLMGLEDADCFIRVKTMFLVSNAYYSQLQASLISCRQRCPNADAHLQGLSVLTMAHVGPERILAMLRDDEQLIRRYGVIALKRFYETSDEMLSTVLAHSDADIRKFGKWYLEDQSSEGLM